MHLKNRVALWPHSLQLFINRLFDMGKQYKTENSLFNTSLHSRVMDYQILKL